MGINSTEVSYGFGQMGSVFTNLAKPVFPPKDHVIVAIQFLAENTPTVLETETLDSHGPQFPTHQDDELASAGGPDANYLGVVEAPATSGVAATGVITLTAEIAATNALIKPGQVVLIGADADTIDAGITVDTAAGHIDPIYNGPNAQWLEVVSISGTALTVKGVGKGTTANLGSIDTSNTLYFLDGYHGAGGTTTESVAFPSGVTIYGRWSTITPSAAACICYFGK
jgi:hypothetical protein